MRIQNKQIIASILFVLISFVSMSQGQGPCAGCPNPPCAACCPNCGGPPPPPGLTIDEFLIFGIAFALIFGVKKILSFNRNN